MLDGYEGFGDASGITPATPTISAEESALKNQH